VKWGFLERCGAAQNSRMSPSAVRPQTMSKAGMAAPQTAGQALLVVPYPHFRLPWLQVDPKCIEKSPDWLSGQVCILDGYRRLLASQCNGSLEKNSGLARRRRLLPWPSDRKRHAQQQSRCKCGQ
jgi:hypothetical protein